MNDSYRSAEWETAYGSIGAVTTAQLTNIPLHILDPWTGADGQSQPFREYPESKLLELAENIEKNGVIEPICVRPLPTGRYQIIAGHNRVAASRLVGLTKIPALIQQMTDAEAAVRMVDSNLQHREQLLPSEKAWAYRERMEALKQLNTDRKGTGKSRDLVAEETNESTTQIQRYIRLSYLQNDLLNRVDAGSLSLRAGVEISYLAQQEQNYLILLLEDKRCKVPSMSQATSLHRLSSAGQLDQESMLAILCPQKPPKPAAIKLPAERISALFPDNITIDQMEAEIYEALLAYRQGGKV